MQIVRTIKTKYQELSAAKRAALWLAASSIILKGVSFFTAPLFAVLLSEYEFGKLSLFTSYEQIIIICATWSAALGAYRSGLFRYKDHVPALTNAVLIFSNFLTIITFGLLFLFADKVMAFTKFSLWGLLIIFLYTLTYPAYECWVTKAKVDYNYKKLAVVTTLLPIVQTLSALMAILTIGATADVKFIFMLVPAILLNTVVYAKTFRLRVTCENKSVTCSQIKFVAAFSFPLVFHSMSFLLLSQADRIMIGQITGEIQAGIYSVAYTIASIAQIIQNAVSEAFIPWLFRSLEQKRYERIGKQFVRLLVIFGGVYLVFIMMAPEVIILLYPQSYHAGIWCLPPIAIGTYFMFFYSVFVNIQEYYGETKYIALVSCVCALLNIVMNYFGIQYFGYIACAYTTLICYILFAVGHYVFMSKVLRKRAEGVRIFACRQLVLIAAAMLFCMVAITLLYRYMLLRYLIVAVVLPVTLLAVYKYWTNRQTA